MIQSVAARNEYVEGVYYRTDSRLVEVPSDIPPDVGEIYLENNEISGLTSGTFTNFTRCTKLSIHSNLIATIEEETFAGMVRLHVLYLYHNKITFLQKSMFNGLPSITLLHLTHNLIETVPNDCFKDLTTLHTLKLHNNKLSEISGNMWRGLHGLKELHLHYNNITTLQLGDLDYLNKLEFLSLYMNPLTTLSHTIFTPSAYPHTNGHPEQIKLALGLMDCDSSLCWIKQGEQRGWITWWASQGKTYYPDCRNLHSLWSDVDLNCLNNGLLI